MKILAINASHRGDKGFTRFLIDKLFQGASSAGGECEVVTLANNKINRCLACDKCHSIEEDIICVYENKDDVHSIFNKMADSDIIIYATPIYIFGMSGLLKTFIDRMYALGNMHDIAISKYGYLFHPFDQKTCSKPFVLLVSCNSIEKIMPNNVVSYFKTYSRFMDAPQVGTLIRNGARLIGHGNDPQRENLFPKIQEIYSAFVQAGHDLVETGRVRPSTQRKTNQGFIQEPFYVPLLQRIPLRSMRNRIIRNAKKVQFYE